MTSRTARPLAILRALLVALVCLPWLSVPNPLHAQEEPAPLAESPGDDPGETHEVAIGLLLNRVSELSIRDNRFTVDFYIWFRWKEPDLEPHESFEIVNGTIDSRQLSDARVLPDGMSFSCYRMSATIYQNYDVKRFPRDHHDLVIEIEDGRDEAFLRYVPDRENSGLNADFAVPGFSAKDFQMEVVPFEYRTNFGDTSLPSGSESTYSRVRTWVEVSRSSRFFSWKLFFGLYTAALIGFLALVLPFELDARFSLGVAAIFAIVASQFVLSSQLPESDQVTVADQIVMLSTAAIFLSLAQSTYGIHLVRAGRQAFAYRLNAIVLAVLVVAYVAGNFICWF